MGQRLTVLFLLISASAASAQVRNVVHQFNGAITEGVHYDIDGDNVYIIAGIANPTSRFKLEARTERWNGSQGVDDGPGFINLIGIQPGISDPGTVRIEINGNADLNHVHGATDIREIRLPTQCTAGSHIYRIRILGSLGVTRLDDFDSVGLVEVGGSLLNDLVASSITNAITIQGNLVGGIWGASTTAITVNGAGPQVGPIFCSNTYSGTCLLSGSYAGTITLNAGLSGVVTMNGNLTGRVAITGTASGSVRIRGNLVGGATATTGKIQVNGTLSGRILIDGALIDGGGGDEISVTTLASTSAIVMDYDGFEDSDDWGAGATVRVGALPPYGSNPGNYPSSRIYRITGCRGDMNNDGAVDASDDDGFGRSQSSYAGAYPGLDGSWHFHADTNQDNHRWDDDPTPPQVSPNADDQTVYDAIQAAGCCITTCSSCEGDVDSDLDVDLTDSAIVLANFGGLVPPAPACADQDGSGTIDLPDISIVLANFGATCSCGELARPGGGEQELNGSGGCVDPAFVVWAQDASIGELFDWLAQWDGDNCNAGEW